MKYPGELSQLLSPVLKDAESSLLCYLSLKYIDDDGSHEAGSLIKIKSVSEVPGYLPG